ncbi:MAG: hypothetical protein AAGI44_11425 [Pseudomonadota bacterium]
MQRWRPSARCMLSLKQLGFTPLQIDQTLSLYLESTDQPSDAGFRSALKANTRLCDDVQAKLRNRAKMSLHWQPTSYVTEALSCQGFDSDAITYYRSTFVVRARESGEVICDPDAAFIAYCRTKPRRLAEPLPPDWVPEAATITTAMVRTNWDWYAITDQLAQFLHTHQYALSSDWNATFLSWITSNALPTRHR